MPAAKYDLIIEQGATLRKKFRLTDSAGVGVDLTGSTLRGQIRAYPSSSSILGSFTFEISDQTQAETKGEFFVIMSAANTSLLPGSDSKNPGIQFKDLSYDIERVLPDSSVHRILNGLARISSEVTR